MPAAPAKHIPSVPCVQPVDIPSARLTLETQTDNSDQRDPPLMNTPDMTPPVIPAPDIHVPPPGTPVHVETPPLDVPVTTPRQPPQQRQGLPCVTPRRSTRPRVEPTWLRDYMHSMGHNNPRAGGQSNPMKAQYI